MLRPSIDRILPMQEKRGTAKEDKSRHEGENDTESTCGEKETKRRIDSKVQENRTATSTTPRGGGGEPEHQRHTPCDLHLICVCHPQRSETQLEDGKQRAIAKGNSGTTTERI